jgi:hypothetical protein
MKLCATNPPAKLSTKNNRLSITIVLVLYLVKPATFTIALTLTLLGLGYILLDIAR